MGLLLLLILIVALIAVLPRWPYSYEWGYSPSRVVGLILIIILILILLNLISFWKVEIKSNDDETIIKIEKQG